MADQTDYAFLINYAHGSDGVFESTTLTNFGGEVKGSTTIGNGINKTEKSLNLSFESFD